MPSNHIWMHWRNDIHIASKNEKSSKKYGIILGYTQYIKSLISWSSFFTLVPDEYAMIIVISHLR